MSFFISRTDDSLLGRWWWSVDRWLLGIVALLIVFGTVLVAASSPAIAERHGSPAFYFVVKHLFYLIPSVAIMVGLSALPPKTARRIASVVFLFSLVALFLVPLMGSEFNGARRWISIAGQTVQPSEFIKPSFAVVAAWLFASQHRDFSFPGYYASVALYVLIAGLLMAQPDLGMTVVVTAVWSAQLFMAGLALSVVAGLIVLAAGGMCAAYMMFPHVTSRIDRFLDSKAGDTYQVDRSIEAFRNGGFFGTGPGQGEIKNVLPDAHADFIFAVSGEEFGLVLTLVLVALYIGLILRGMRRIRQCDNLFAMLAVSGLLTQIGVQALVHMGSSLRLLPAKGMTLPFVSYGGSSLLALGFAMGIVLCLTRQEVLKRGNA
jgi:cell division protein FtsW